MADLKESQNEFHFEISPLNFGNVNFGNLVVVVIGSIFGKGEAVPC